jgi:fatty-acyl-CoA synthase
MTPARQAASTLPERLTALAEAAPTRESLRVVTPGEADLVLTRAAFFSASREAADRLAGAGVGPADLAILVQRDVAALAMCFFGASLLGAIPSIMPFQTEKLHPDRYRAAMSALIDLSEPRAVITESALRADVAALLPGGGPHLVSLDRADLLNIAHPPTVDHAIDPESIALLQHSSGTTGLQKGVALSHRAIFEQIERYGAVLDFSESDVVVSWLPLYHDMGLIAGFLMPLLGGARLVLMNPLDWVRAPHMLLRAISDHGGTLCWLPNFAYNFCAQKIRDDDLVDVDLGSMRAFVNCSEPIYAQSHDQFLQRFAPCGVERSMLHTSYAMAEAVFAVTQSELGAPASVDVVDRAALHGDGVASPPVAGKAAHRVVSSGRPIPGMAVRVLDADRTPLSDRRVGEIAIRSTHMLSGYYRRPEETERAFHEGWYLTGDMGYVADGEVYVLGRKKDLIIVGGRNIYPRDLETLVNAVAGVHPGRVVAFGVPNPARGTEDVAVIAELADGVGPNGDGANEDRRRIAADIRRAVAAGTDIMVRHVELVPRGWLVKTSSGKVARAANRDRFLAAHPEIDAGR